MRVVLDTNVLLAGMLGSRGLCESLVDDLFGSPACVIVLSEHILAEFERNALAKFRLSADEATRALAYLRENTVLVQPGPIPEDTPADPDDLPVLGTAAAAEADYLITGDRALLDLGRIGSTRIVSPRDFVERQP